MFIQLPLLAALLTTPAPSAAAEPLRLRVQVVDSACVGIPGATVLLGRTVIGNVTDADGWVELTIPPTWQDSTAFILDVQSLFCVRQRLRVALPVRRYPLGQVFLAPDWAARRIYEKQHRFYYLPELPHCSHSEPNLEPLPGLEPVLTETPARPAPTRRRLSPTHPKRQKPAAK